MSLPPTDPFDLAKRPKPSLSGYYWEDIVFVPARPGPPPRIERVRARLNTHRGQLTLVLAIVGALTAFMRMEPKPADQQFASTATDPETTGSMALALRPTLPE